VLIICFENLVMCFYTVTLEGGTLRSQGYFCKKLRKFTCKTPLASPVNVLLFAGAVIDNARNIIQSHLRENINIISLTTLNMEKEDYIRVTCSIPDFASY
jgi:hypothetical protein